MPPHEGCKPSTCPVLNSVLDSGEAFSVFYFRGIACSHHESGIVISNSFAKLSQPLTATGRFILCCIKFLFYVFEDFGWPLYFHVLPRRHSNLSAYTRRCSGRRGSGIEVCITTVAPTNSVMQAHRVVTFRLSAHVLWQYMRV